MSPGAVEFPERLYFLHVDKCGGSSIRLLLDSAVAQCEVFPGGDLADLPASADQGGISQFRLYRGHFGAALFEHLTVRPEVVIWLRDPVARLRSQFGFWKQMRHLAEDVCFSDWLQARKKPSLLRGIFYDLDSTIWPDQSGPLMRRAMDLISSCRVVGLLERQEESVQLLCYRLGLLPPPRPPRINAGRHPAAKTALTAEEKALAEDFSREDREIYAHAEAVFLSQMEQMDRELWGDSKIRGIQARQAELERRYWERCSWVRRSVLDYPFDQPLVGWGWHQREQSPGDFPACFRWTGAEEESVIWLPLDRTQPLEIEVETANSLSPGDPPFFLAVDGEVLDLRRVDRSKGSAVAGRWMANLPEAAVPLVRPASALSFRAKACACPSDLDASSLDSRQLGVAVRSIRVRRWKRRKGLIRALFGSG